MKNILKKLLSASIALTMVTPFVAQAQNDIYDATQVKHEVVQDGSIAFPNPSDSYLSQAPIYNKADLKLLTYGLNKDDVRRILGNPHFNEFAPKNWNYLVSVETGELNQVNTCQLQVHFGDDGLANKIYWNDPDCINLTPSYKPKPKTVEPVESQVVDVVETEPKPSFKKTLIEIKRIDIGNGSEVVSRKDVFLD